MTQTGCIYSITCKVNGKRYIGQTIKNPAERWRLHLQVSKKKDHHPMYQEIRKYGQGMFVFRVIEEDVPVSELDKKECYWIEQFDTFNNGYNRQTGGNVGWQMCEDDRAKLSSIAKERAKHHKPFTIMGDGKHHRCKVRGTHKTTGEVIEFNSLTEAANKVSMPIGNISRSIKQGYTAAGYKWEKLENKTINNRIYGKRVLDGKVIHHFDSLNQAAKTLGTGNSSTLVRALKNPSRYSWKGCRWYKEED